MGVSFETCHRQHVQGCHCLCPCGCLLRRWSPRLRCPPLRLSTRKRSFPPSLSPTSMESTTTTARPTSRRQRLRTLTALLPAAMGSPCPTAGSRPPSTPLTTSTASSPRSATRAPQSTLPSLLRVTAMPPPLLHTPLLPPCTSPLLKPIAQTFKL